jgi:hypothetical protein
METLTIDKDIKVFYVTATSFPEGIMDAHRKLHGLIPFSQDRKYFGISRPENGTIVYRAAAEEMEEGEAQQLKCETLVLKKGKYISVTLSNYREDMTSIKKTFDLLLTRTDLDPQGYCVEWYLNEKEVKCMIRLKD